MTQRLFRKLLTVALVLVMLCSLVFLALEAEHDCHGEDCAICAQLAVCENLLKSLVLTAALLTALRIRMAVLPETRDESLGAWENVTPVTLKVKLSD